MLLSEIVIGDDYTIDDVAVECRPPRWRAVEIVRRQTLTGGRRLVRHVLIDELDYETGAIIPRYVEVQAPGESHTRFSRTGRFMLPAELAPFDSARTTHERWRVADADSDSAADLLDIAFQRAGIAPLRVTASVGRDQLGKVTIQLDVPNATALVAQLDHAHARGED